MQTAFSTRELSSGGILSGRLATNSKPPYLTAVVPHLKAARSNRLSQPVAGRASETHQEYQSLGGDQEPAVQDQLCSSQQQQAARRSNPYPLKNVQLGHSRFSRGAPHVCYGQVGSSGIFYIKPEVDELIDDWQQWLAQPRQYWQQRQQQFERWATSQKEQLPDYSKDQHGGCMLCKTVLWQMCRRQGLCRGISGQHDCLLNEKSLNACTAQRTQSAGRQQTCT